MSQHFTPVSSGARLSDQVAEQLSAEIKQGRLAPGDKLPTEARLVEHEVFGLEGHLGVADDECLAVCGRGCAHDEGHRERLGCVGGRAQSRPQSAMWHIRN